MYGYINTASFPDIQYRNDTELSVMGMPYLLNGADDCSTLQALHQPTGHAVIETTYELLGSRVENAAVQVVVRNCNMFLEWSERCLLVILMKAAHPFQRTPTEHT